MLVKLTPEELKQKTHELVGALRRRETQVQERKDISAAYNDEIKQLDKTISRLAAELRLGAEERDEQGELPLEERLAVEEEA